ncbi:MAG: nuclear transport factor 2 family protein [Balneolaceae bacterium]
MPHRSTEEVFLDHLELAQNGDVETDLHRNFAEECVLLTTYGIFSGFDGIRDAANLLQKQIGDTTYEYHQKIFHGEIAFLEWSAKSEQASIDDGADSFLIRNGRIEVMTIHYSVVEI